MPGADVRIDSVEVVPVDTGGPCERGDSRQAVLVRAGGAVGCFGPVDDLPAAVVAARLGAAAVGWPVADHGGLVRHLFAQLGQHRAGLGSWAVGVLDCAVWDLHGVLAERPLAHLLAETPVAGRVPVYVSWLSLDLRSGNAEGAVRQTARQGFAFTKWAVRAAGESARSIASLAGRTSAWAGAPVAIDALGTWDTALAAAVARALPEGAVRWVEDPLPETDCQEYRELRDARSPLPVAFGERVTSALGARRLLAHCRPAAFTFDVAWCGGITEALRLLDLARAASIPVHLHGRALVPAVHLAAAFPQVAGAVEYQLVWEPRRQRALAHPLKPTGGHITLPDRPGLGLTLRWP
ncbi:mandelate racemase [Streptomyces mobaraensis]|uniref:Mandelate racemase n=1 Tax=Streptomyces mobaraensis TaxID=35621 RepID=A0A5N5W203_STRMB|nr:mandelate racemase [Streptomyces mobaraensis]